MTPGDFSKTFGRLHLNLEEIPLNPGQIVGKWTPKNYFMYHSKECGQRSARREEEEPEGGDEEGEPEFGRQEPRGGRSRRQPHRQRSGGAEAGTDLRGRRAADDEGGG